MINVPVSRWSATRHRATAAGLVLFGVTAALVFGVRAPVIALLIVTATSLMLMAASLPDLARDQRPPSALAGASVISSGPRPPIARFPDREPRVICDGWLRPRVLVSTGALFELPNEKLGELLAHQRHHARRRDPLRLALVNTLVSGLPFLPALRPLVPRYARRLEAGALRVAGAARPAPSDREVRAVPCRFEHPHGDPGRARRTLRNGLMARVVTALALVALGTLTGHAIGVIDMPSLDAAVNDTELCLVVIVSVLTLGVTTARQPVA